MSLVRNLRQDVAKSESNSGKLVAKQIALEKTQNEKLKGRLDDRISHSDDVAGPVSGPILCSIRVTVRYLPWFPLLTDLLTYLVKYPTIYLFLLLLAVQNFVSLYAAETCFSKRPNYVVTFRYLFPVILLVVI